MKRSAVCVAGLLISGWVYAQDKPDALETADKACMDKASSTASMSECADASYKRWDQELNRVYSALRGKLNAPAQAALKSHNENGSPIAMLKTKPSAPYIT